MDPQWKKEWVKALRSGEYTQTQGTLYRTDGPLRIRMCCLGVLCDVAAKKGIGYWEKSGTINEFHFGVLSHSTTLPDTLKAFVKLYNVNVFVEMNDIYEYSFEEIADYIEADL